jgi:hypothetical protein
VIAVEELGLTLLYVPRPFVSDSGLELGRLRIARPVRDDDASAHSEAIIWIIFFVDWCQEVREWVLVNIRQVSFGLMRKVDTVDAGRE